MQEIILEQVGPLLMQLVVIIVGIASTWLGVKAGMVQDKIKQSKELENFKKVLEANRELASITVEYVEQVGKVLTSDEKKALAREKFLSFAEERGIEISETELDVLIEQAVHSFNRGLDDSNVVIEDVDSLYIEGRELGEGK